MIFVIEDKRHAEPAGDYPTREAAFAALQQLAQTPWDKSPNRAPCQNWEACGRSYELITFDDTAKPWRGVSRSPILDVTKAGATWLSPLSAG